MAGFLSRLKSGDATMRGPAVKDRFPLRDEDDPRVLYVLSDRARRISIKVKTADREVHVVVPGLRALKKAQSFAKEQRDWINVQLETLPPPMPFTPGQTILFQGQDYQLLSPAGTGRPKINRATHKIIVPSPDPESFPGRVRRLLIREAREELTAASHHYADKLGKTVGKVSVRDQSSRWGSCITRNGEGHISYSWRLICAPPFVLEYVAAHECAHLVHDDHSKAFWDCCHSIFDEVKPATKWLNKNGATLHAIGAEF
ncbi:M48 family metallopeptidase [Litorimonas sp. RW-G-Af-16]|uniref:M48 family metallopeptidase n=1 Tax=Litorimonas sp. RW-G-Af-16 TaxID=3241168 RepID=UPI00390C793B